MTLLESELLYATLTLIVRLGLLVLFVFSLVHKLRNLPLFNENIRDYRLTAEGMNAVVAAAILFVEFSIVILLVAKPPIGFCLAGIMLLLYAGAMLVNLLRGRSTIDCGCGRAGAGQTISYALVIRNIVISLLAFLATQGLFVTSISQPQLLLGMAGLLVTVLLYSAINELLVNAPKLKKLRTP